jgi:hypothetical protein
LVKSCLLVKLRFSGRLLDIIPVNLGLKPENAGDAEAFEENSAGVLLIGSAGAIVAFETDEITIVLN